jgi:hypothetical protein
MCPLLFAVFCAALARSGLDPYFMGESRGQGRRTADEASAEQQRLVFLAAAWADENDHLYAVAHKTSAQGVHIPEVVRLTVASEPHLPSAVNEPSRRLLVPRIASIQHAIPPFCGLFVA